MKVGFSIRYKFLLVMSLLLAACVCIYLVIAIEIFKEDKEKLVFDLNRSQVSNLASELDTQFEGISDKFKLFAILAGGAQSRWVGELFTKDSDVVFVSLSKRNGTEEVRKYENKSYRETYALAEGYFEALATERPVPYSNILKNGEAIWNATTKGGPPLIGFGRSVVVEDNEGVAVDQMAVIGYVKADQLLSSLSRVTWSEITVANSDGEILVHADQQALRSKVLILGNPLFQSAKESQIKTQVAPFEMKGQKFLGAFSKSYKGQVLVLAQASQASAFAAITQLVERSLILALIVMTFAFLAAVLLSRSLTEPLAKLVDRMSLVSQGDLTSQIPIQTRDETAVLASSFNQMIYDLKLSRDQLVEINRDLDLKVQDRTRQLEEQNHKVKEAQEALLRTTRLASAGEIAGRAAHEVLNPLTSLLTRVGIMEKKVKTEMPQHVQMLADIAGAWRADFAEGGFEKLLASWKKPSQINPEWNLWTEDLENLNGLHDNLKLEFSSFHQDTQFLLREGARINKIINGMRKLSNIKSDRRDHSAHEILKDCCHIMADLFYQRGYKILQEFQAPSDLVHVDRDEMVQAVTNMMRNSLQAMSEAESIKGKKGTLRLVTQVAQGQLQIDIEDSGAGVAPEHQSHLFKSQFTTKSSEEGTGLGLGISRRFIRGYDGDIEFVSSIPFDRTVFRIRLPLVRGAEKGAAA